MARLTKEEIFDEVMHRLGADGVAVELTEKDLETALRDALRRYSRSNPIRDRESKIVPARCLKVHDIHPDTYAVVEVDFQDQLQVLEGQDAQGFNLFNPWQMIGAGYGAGGFGDTTEYAYLVEWRNLTRREFSLEPDYYWEDDPQYSEDDDTTELPKTLYLFNPTGLDVRATYVCVRPRLLKEVSPRDHDWIISWTLADAKEILGRKRGKFPVVPSAGQQLKMDGEALMAEAREDKVLLMDDLAQRYIGEPTYIVG